LGSDRVFPCSIHHLLLDLSSLKSVTTAAQTFLARESKLHALFNNASVLLPDPAGRTAEGYEAGFASAVLGHHVLTLLLLDALSRDGGGRVVSTSSYAAGDVYKPKKLDFSKLEIAEVKDSIQVCRIKLILSVSR
jgi:NAD(P)-dependent dehydrogenase (short-subunit alcohol dehydrogenase family)